MIRNRRVRLAEEVGTPDDVLVPITGRLFTLSRPAGGLGNFGELVVRGDDDIEVVARQHGMNGELVGFSNPDGGARSPNAVVYSVPLSNAEIAIGVGGEGDYITWTIYARSLLQVIGSLKFH